MDDNAVQVARGDGGLVGLDGSIYYFGGKAAQKLAHSETQAFDLATGEWRLIAPLNQGRHGGGAAVLDAEIY